MPAFVKILAADPGTLGIPCTIDKWIAGELNIDVAQTIGFVGDHLRSLRLNSKHRGATRWRKGINHEEHGRLGQGGDGDTGRLGQGGAGDAGKYHERGQDGRLE